jgi:hypothetical protein
MERRSFLLGLMALAAGSASSLQAMDEAQAAPLSQPADGAAQDAGQITLPDGTSIDWAQDQRNPRPQLHYRRMPREQQPRERRRFCQMVQSRHGPPRRRCRWVRS